MPRDAESLNRIRTGYLQLNPDAQPDEVDQFVALTLQNMQQVVELVLWGGYTEQFKDKFNVDQFMGEEQKYLYENDERKKLENKEIWRVWW